MHMQVPVAQSRAYKRMMPDAHLTIIQDGGHFAYIFADVFNQRKAFSALMGRATPAKL